MAAPAETSTFRGGRFVGADLTGATFHDCDLRHVKVVDSWLTDVRFSGEVDRFVVNDVDVSGFVHAELDRRHPERIQLRTMRTADDHRAMWETLRRLWAAALDRAACLPEASLHQRVDDEWSFVETLRHLIFCADAWVSRTILDEALPYHRLGYPQTGYPPEDAAALGIDVDARPTLAEVIAVRAETVGVVARVLRELTDADLARVHEIACPGIPEQERTVGRCLRLPS